MVAKMILPFLGGSPAVWNTSLMFYQACLLAGYAYAHFGGLWLSTRRQAQLHLLLAFAALWMLPLTLPLEWLKNVLLAPVHLVLMVLVGSVGFPFFILAAGTPLVQRWFVATAQSGVAVGSQLPYFLPRESVATSGSFAENTMERPTATACICLWMLVACLGTITFSPNSLAAGVASQQGEATLEETLVNGLKVRTDKEKAFIARVVQTVEQGKLSESLVKAIFQRARVQHSQYPLPYFTVMIQRVAKQRGVDL